MPAVFETVQVSQFVVSTSPNLWAGEGRETVRLQSVRQTVLYLESAEGALEITPYGKTVRLFLLQ